MTVRDKHPEYRSWESMMARCYNVKHVAYANYGGRGIAVCERWKDFYVFLLDMGPRPTLSHTLDRIDNDKGYEPGNARWATRKEQQNNRRCNLFIEVNGERKTASQWAEQYGIPKATLLGRVHRGYLVGDLFRPAKDGRRTRLMVNWRGESLSLVEAAERSGLSVTTLRKRFKSGQPLDEPLRPSNESEPVRVCG